MTLKSKPGAMQEDLVIVSKPGNEERGTADAS
jgi:hypothetical protein